MIPFGIPEIEEQRDTLYLYRALRKIRDALNLIVGTLATGTATLANGIVIVKFDGIQTGSRIFLSRQKCLGTPGHLSVDPLSYDTRAKTFVISSTSVTDGSVVAWLNWA